MVSKVTIRVTALSTDPIYAQADTSLQDIQKIIRITDNTPNGPSLDDDDRLGRSVASIGDLNGDGMNDLAIGASGNDAGRGAVHIILCDYSVAECYKILLGLA